MPRLFCESISAKKAFITYSMKNAQAFSSFLIAKKRLKPGFEKTAAQ